MNHPDQSSEWTARDQTLLRTAQIMYALGRGEYDRIDPLSVSFAVGGSYPDNKIVLNAPFTLYSFEATGDGSYQHNSGFFFATGGVGLALTGAYMVGRAIGNANRRNAAAQAATPTWHPIDTGFIFVNQYGFYLRTPVNLLWWNWASIAEAQMIAPRQFAMLGDAGNRGRVNYVIDSDAAELVFALWASAQVPQHAQLRQRIWLIPAWFEKYRATFGTRSFNFMSAERELPR